MVFLRHSPSKNDSDGLGIRKFRVQLQVPRSVTVSQRGDGVAGIFDNLHTVSFFCAGGGRARVLVFD